MTSLNEGVQRVTVSASLKPLLDPSFCNLSGQGNFILIWEKSGNFEK